MSENAHIWMMGLCSIMAHAIQRHFGGELYAVVNHSHKYDDDMLWHCYCVIGNMAYDAIGAHSIEEASNTSDENWPIPDMDKDCEVEMQWRKVDVQWLEKVHEDFNQLQYHQKADTYIDMNRHLFPIDPQNHTRGGAGR